MVDPFTAVAAATAAFNGIKKAISVGRDIQDMAGQLGQWSKAISDFNYAADKAEKPKWYKALGSKHKADAVQIWAEKKKVENMRDELRSFISSHYGPSAWQEILRIEAQIRQDQKDAVYAAQEMKERIIEWTLGIFLFLLTSSVFVFIVWLIYNKGNL